MVTETAAEEEAEPGSRRRRLRTPHRPAAWSDWAAPAAAIAVTLLGLAPVLSVLIQRAGRPYLPMQDAAVIDLRVRDVLTFSQNTPLVGAYSHFRWNHPGPALFYLVAPIAWVFGNPAWATLVGFAVLQGIAVVWTARLAWKTGGLRWTVIWMAVMALTYVGSGPAILQVAWNPSVALPFFVLFLLQCWVVARGDARRLLGLAFVATFLVQAHIGYAVLVAVLGGWSVVRLAVDLRSRRQWPGVLDLVPAVVVVVLMWLPAVVLDPVVNGSSNLSRVVHFYLHPPKNFPRAGLGDGLGFLATEFRWVPPWLGGANPVSYILRQDAIPSSVAWLAIPVVLLALAWWSAWRSRRRDLRILAELVGLLLVASAFSLTMIQGERSLYLFYWRIVAGVAAVVLTGAILVDSFAGRRWGSGASKAWAVLLAAATAVAALSIAPAAGNGRGPESGLEAAAASIVTQLNREGQPDGPVLVRQWGTTTGGLAAGLIDQLAREGKPVFVDRSLGFELGYGRTAGPGDVHAMLYVTESSAIFNTGSRLSGVKVLARTHPLPPGPEAELARLQLQLADQLKQNGAATYIEDLGSPYVTLELAHVPGLDRVELERLAQLNGQVAAHGCLCGVLEFPADKNSVYNPVYMTSVVRGPAGLLSAR